LDRRRLITRLLAGEGVIGQQALPGGGEVQGGEEVSEQPPQGIPPPRVGPLVFDDRRQ
jgi:hypothetical protein